MASDVLLKLMVMSGPDDGLIHTLQGDFVYDQHLDVWRCRFAVGRRDKSDICIAFDTLVSRLHATVQVSPEGEIWLIDENSRNGTYVTRDRLTVPETLVEGQMFRIGKTWLRVQFLQLMQEV